MCGVAGIFLRETPIEQERLERMAARLVHRGPDDAGIYIDRCVGLAQTRLSVVGLSDGHQPLFARNGNLVLIANGEIYNHIELRAKLEARGHRFSTHSDCETILHAYAEYGETFLQHLHGMFAFALYDQQRQRLMLARDRLGIKPLFLAQFPTGMAFASEIKALLALEMAKPELNPAGVVQYFQHQFSSGKDTVLAGIERVRPGEALWIEQGTIVRRWRYWSMLNVKPIKVSYEEAQAQFDTLFETVIKEHMCADVPFGLFLSGGVDSSVLLALLTRFNEEPIRTFSVGFSGTSIASELPIARRTASLFGSRNVGIEPTSTDIGYALPETIWAADELMRGDATLPTVLLAREAGRDLKVVFSGEGGDEVFAGYGSYRASRWVRLLRRLVHPGSGGFHTNETLSHGWARRLFRQPLLAALDQARAPFITAWKETPDNWSDLQRMQYVDLVTALPDKLLVKLDRMLMAWGVEGRVPFLDHRVVEFGLALPDKLKVNDKIGKVFLKRWATRFLPHQQMFSRKRGFAVPMQALANDEFLLCLRKLLPRNPAIRESFHPPTVTEIIDRFRRDSTARSLVWALLQFAIWHRLIIVERGAARPPSRQDPLELLAP